MSTELTPSERAAYEWIARSLPKGYWAVMLFVAGMLIVLWFALGPSHPWYAVMVVMGTLMFGPGAANPVMRRVPRSWFRVPAAERVLHRILGVGTFRWQRAHLSGGVEVLDPQAQAFQQPTPLPRMSAPMRCRTRMSSRT